MSKPPNLILFNPDQFRSDVLAHMGNPAAVTPNLDRLAATDAVSFSQAFCQNPVCIPSRCSFMTGWYPHTLGHRTMRYMLQPGDPMLLKTLRENGYFVWWGGKNDLVAGQNGYDEYCDIKYQAPDDPNRPMRPNLHSWHEWRGDPDGEDYYSFFFGKIENETGAPYVYDGDWAMIEGAIEFIRTYDGDKPFCIFLPVAFPHPPYAVEDPWFSMIARDALPPRISAPSDWHGKPSILAGLHDLHRMDGWPEERWTELRATYYGSCARVDHSAGMVLDALRDAGVYDETAFIFFSDHGDFTGDYGLVEKTENTFEECLTRVPFIIKPPANVPVQPRVSDALVELVDLPATVAALAGIELDYTQFGHSLLPLVAGATDDGRDAVFCQGGRLHREPHIIDSQQHPQGKQWHYWPRRTLQARAGPEHTKATMCRTDRYKYVHRLYEQDELYDLQTDPGELHNRIDDPALADVLAAHKERLMRFYLETNDVVPHQLDERE